MAAASLRIVSKYRCELRDRDGSSVLVDIDLREWPVLPDAIVYRGRLFVLNTDYLYREARVFWYTGEQPPSRANH